MASTRRRARTAVMAVGLAWAVAAPGLSAAAEAKPPPLVAHGREHASPGQALEDVPPAQSRKDRVPPGQARKQADAVQRATSRATVGTQPGRGGGHGGIPPGQAKKSAPRPSPPGAPTPDVPATPPAPAPAPAVDAAAPPPWSPDRPSGSEVPTPALEVPAPTAEPVPATPAPATATPPPATPPIAAGAAADATAATTTVGPDTPPEAVAAEPEQAAPSGALVRLPDVAGRVGELLADVGTTIQRAVPAPLDVPDRPLAELVPVLLAVLGAFLALQRGLGQGLGHVPMTTPTRVRRGR